jgi:hypothetical protein
MSVMLKKSENNEECLIEFEWRPDRDAPLPEAKSRIRSRMAIQNRSLSF